MSGSCSIPILNCWIDAAEINTQSMSRLHPSPLSGVGIKLQWQYLWYLFPLKASFGLLIWMVFWWSSLLLICSNHFSIVCYSFNSLIVLDWIVLINLENSCRFVMTGIRVQKITTQQQRKHISICTYHRYLYFNHIFAE